MSAEYRIEFTIQRAESDSDEFVDIGFGSSGSWRDLVSCTHTIDSAVSHYEWETEGDMPTPDAVRDEIEATS